MYKLYWNSDTGAFAPQAVCEEAGIAHELVTVDTKAGAHREPAYLAINPRGQVPALVLPDGSVMTESAAIVQHLVDAHPEAGLAPAPGSSARAQFDRWLIYMAVDIYSADLRIYYADRFTSDPAGAEAVKAAGLQDMERGLDIVEAQLAGAGPFMMGAEYSALDPYLTMLVQWFPDVSGLLDSRPAIAKLCAAVRARPAIARIWAQNFPEAA